MDGAGSLGTDELKYCDTHKYRDWGETIEELRDDKQVGVVNMVIIRYTGIGT